MGSAPISQLFTELILSSSQSQASCAKASREAQQVVFRPKHMVIPNKILCNEESSQQVLREVKQRVD